MTNQWILRKRLEYLYKKWVETGEEVYAELYEDVQKKLSLRQWADAHIQEDGE